MGRRSVAAERRRQIIAVTIESIATHGVRGTTLERVADMAEMARGHVRHFVGNRDELITDAARAFYFGDDAIDDKDLDRVASAEPIVDPGWTADEAMDYLFGEFAAPGSESAAAFSFADASRSMPAVHEIVLRAYTGIQSSLIEILRRECPQASEAKRRAVAYGVLTIALGNTYILDLEMSEQRIADARSSAEALIAALRNAPEVA